MTDYFEKLSQGDIREQILESFRNSLRALTDPDTGEPPSEDLIRQATMLGSRYWVEANDIDIVSQGIQRRDYFLGQQVDPRTASTAFLENFHGPASGLPRLGATGASGVVMGTGTPGTIYNGSTFIGDPLATSGATSAGTRFQVYADATVRPDGTVPVTLIGIDTGEATEIQVGTKVTWNNPPAGSDPFALVVGEDFEGGTEQETDQEWGNRIFAARSKRARAGNAAHFQLWARRATNAVKRGFVYPCALHSGSVGVAVLQKRGTTKGPLACEPSLAVMSIVTGYIVPPGSAVVPPTVFVLAVAARHQDTALGLKIGMRRGVKAGWADASPWPGITSAPARVLASPAPGALTFSINSDAPLPALGVPQLMIWNKSLSAFERLNVSSVTEVTPSSRYDVVLSSAPTAPLVAGAAVSPYSARMDSIAKGIEAYFDQLGPGEVVDLSNDVRAARAFRRPTPDVEYPQRLDSNIVEYIREALGGSLGASSIAYPSVLPSPPVASISDGPFFLVAGDVGVYSS